MLVYVCVFVYIFVVCVCEDHASELMMCMCDACNRSAVTGSVPVAAGTRQVVAASVPISQVRQHSVTALVCLSSRLPLPTHLSLYTYIRLFTLLLISVSSRCYSTHLFLFTLLLISYCSSWCLCTSSHASVMFDDSIFCV